MNPWNRQTVAAEGQATAVDQGLRSYMLRVYNYMASGVLLTGLVAYFVGQSEAFLSAVLATNEAGQVTGMAPLGWIIAFAPVALVMVIGVRARHMSAASLQLAFWAYAGLFGLSLFSIFLIYTGESIMRVFFITAATFGLLSMYGYTTKKDLTSWGSFLIVGVLAVFVTSIVNIFLGSTGLQMALSYVGVFLAIGLIAYDTQKVKEIYYMTGSEEAGRKASILGALSLYFDFIYLFINLLHIMGNRR